jgi:hypothetical protein
LSPKWFKVIVLFAYFGYIVVVWLVDPSVGQPRLRLEAVATFILVIAYVGIMVGHGRVPTLEKKHGLTS